MMDAQTLHAPMDRALLLARTAVTRWGPDKQTNVVIEECGELIVALQQYRRARIKSDDVMDEVADVMIVALQAAEMHGGIAMLADAMARKLDRLAKRLG